ncbi:MAG: CotH kinase family protein, partial [Verrucomicrobiales bacterium]|nr:CotH kinase family protein [Verrucomicrobiales bacterium]
MRLRTWLRGAAALVCAGLVANVVAAPLITEFSASSGGALFDEDGDRSDWIELHNPDPVAVDLSGYALTNDAGNLEGWELPDVTLPGGGFLVVYASGKDRDVGELHTDFRLAKRGGYLALVEADGQTVVSAYAGYPEQPSGFSYGLAQSGSSEVLTWIPENAACKILVPTADTGTGWRGLGFDDDGWDDGNTGVGYESSSGYEDLIGANGDVEAEMRNTTGTAYIRLPFLVDDLAGITKLTLRMKYDDGFVAFLNGTRVADGNPPGGALAFDSQAGADHNDGAATTFEDTDLTPFLGDLVEGNNVLAVHGLNNGTGSSDFLILPELNAERVTNPGLGGVGYFGNPSPGSVNGSSAEQGLPAGGVVFSVPGRGYTGTVSLELSTESPAAQIRYTTNGNVPAAGSPLYSGPITISQSTLVRARAFEAGKAPGAVGEEGYIELASSAANFSSDIPVVVMERFSGGPTAANGKQFSFFAFFEPDPNTGRTSLNKAYTSGTRGGWKTRGSSSSGFPKKAYSMEAWNELNENKNIGPFGLPEESDWILSARYTFDRALIRNPLIYRLSREAGRYAVRTRFVELFLNTNGGNLSYGTGSAQDYDGVYTWMEKIARDADRVDVERLPASVTSEPGIAGGYMMKIDRLDPGDSGLNAGGIGMGWVYPKERNVTEEQRAWLGDYLNLMNGALNAADFADPVTGYEKYIDVDSWIDHHLLNVLTKNADALRLSTYFFKTRTGKVEFGPIWDFDRSMESTDGRDDSPLGWSGGTNYFTFQWWNRLFADENFEQRYIDRYFELRDGVLSTANVAGVIDEFADELAESQERNFQRWSGARPRSANQGVGGVTGLNGTHRGEANYLKDWLSDRLNWM